MLICTAVIKHILVERPGYLGDVTAEQMKSLHADLMTGSYKEEQLLKHDFAKKVSSAMEKLHQDVKSESRTAKLWMNYLSQCQMMRLFIYAERTGDLELHLHCVEKMIPIFHASGHLNYAKSSRRYLDTMRELPSIMTNEQYQKYTQEGYFTIRRSHRFWSGVFSDQTIEQKVMRTLKAPGGLAHGRGVTPSTEAKFVHAIPRCIPICHSLEDFCNVHPKSSFQHHDLQEATRVRDGEDASTFYGWISLHSPFQYRNVDGLVDVSSGIVADVTANADKAFEIGQKLAENFSGMAFSEMKVKRTDKCVSIKAASGKIEVRGKEVEYSFDLLFCRVASVITSPAEMKIYMQYEFSKYAMSIFEKGLMRKNTKSVLGTLIKGASGTKLYGKKPEELYVVDGGKFLKSGPWCENGTYRDVCNEYIVYAKQHYTAHAHFLHEGDT